MAGPINPLGGGGVERTMMCGRRLPTPSTGTIGRFVLYIVKFREMGKGQAPGTSVRSVTE